MTKQSFLRNAEIGLAATRLISAAVALLLILGGLELVTDLPASAASDTLSGVITDASAVGVEGVQVQAITAGRVSATTFTAADGSYALQLPAGSYEFVIDWNDAAGDQIDGRTPISISGDAVEDTTLPAMSTANITVEDAIGNAVPNTTVDDNDPSIGSPSVPGQLSDGTSLTWELSAALYGPNSYRCTTNSSGTCAVSGLLGGSLPLLVSIPGALQFDATISTPSDPTNATVRDLNYAQVSSAGSVAGVVAITSPNGTALTGISASPIPSGSLPPGYDPVAGDLGFEVTGLTPGETIEVTVQLPSGSDPTNILKLVSGTYVDASSIATISGDTVALQLTDGGFGDEDGVANGTIVDPLVPVRQIQPQTISFGILSNRTLAQSPISLSATASSGLTVTFASTTPVVCTVSGTLVTLAAVGTCSVKASQGGNSSYTAAPNVTRSFKVT